LIRYLYRVAQPQLCSLLLQVFGALQRIWDFSYIAASGVVFLSFPSVGGWLQILVVDIRGN